jgi:hypothetical protein
VVQRLSFKGVAQGLLRQGFDQEVVHAGGQAGALVLVEGVGGQGGDRRGHALAP